MRSIKHLKNWRATFGTPFGNAISSARLSARPVIRGVFTRCAFFVFLSTSFGVAAVFDYDLRGNLHSSGSDSNVVPVVYTTSTSANIVRLGDLLSLNVFTRGAGTLTYQWRLNGSNIAGATNATYFIPGVTANNGGTYSVVVSNPFGSVTNVMGSVTVSITNNLFAVAYGNGRFVAVGQGGAIVTSTDALAWPQVASGTTNDLRGVTFANNLWVATAKNGNVVTSPDGLVWTVRSTGNSNALNSVAFGNGLYIAVGDNSTILSSTNGINWISRAGSDTLHGVAFGNGNFVAVGDYGTVQYSATGINWTSPSSGQFNHLYGVAFGNGRFTAVGSSVALTTSPNGTNWSAQNYDSPVANLEAVTYFNGGFWAVGPPQTNYLSADGYNWHLQSSVISQALHGIAAGNGLLVAVGDGGLITQPPAAPLSSFKWGVIPASQFASSQIPVTVTAMDLLGNVTTNFTDTVTLSASKGCPDVVVAAGISTWSYPLAGYNRAARVQSIYRPSEIGTAQTITALALNVAQLPLANQVFNRWTLRMKHTTQGSFVWNSAWETSGWTLVHQSNQTVTNEGWVTFLLSQPFSYNGVDNLMVDFSFINSSAGFGVDVAATPSAQARSLRGSVSGASTLPETWSGTTPQPVKYFIIPTIRFSSDSAPGAAPIMSIAPTTTAAFANGVWSGLVTFSATGTNIILQASAMGLSGFSNPFNVATNLLPPPQILLSGANFGFNSNHFGFTIGALPGQTVIIEASTNLVNWVPVNIVLMGALSAHLYSDSQSGLYAYRFYRARLLNDAYPADLTENNAADWGAFASDNAVASVSNSTVRIKEGVTSVLLTTASGFDTGFKYPSTPSLDFNATSYDLLSFWEYPENTTPFGWQVPQPIVVIHTSGGTVTLTPDTQLTGYDAWQKFVVPLAGGAGWTRTTTGTPDMEHVAQIEIHHDTWDAGFRIWLDGVRFESF